MIALIGFYLLLVVYFFVCLFLILVILAQEGKGGGLSGLGGASAIGETFGFGAAGSALRKWTRNIAISFIVLTIVLTFWGEYIAKSRVEKFLSGGPEQIAPAASPTPASAAQEKQAPMSEAGAPAKATAIPPSSAVPSGTSPAQGKQTPASETGTPFSKGTATPTSPAPSGSSSQ